MVGGRNGISALVLGQIHGSIGHLDKLLRRRAVQRIAGDTKTGADVFLAQQRIGGYPPAQFCRQLPGVLHVGLRHQDDEFVSAVTGNDIGTAAIGFEDVADTLENEIAFQVAVKIVDELEAVEVHQDQSKGAAGSRGAFPLGGKSFHEKAVRFDASEAVRDGLLLRLLERKSIVQGAGDEVGKRAKQENFLFGEFDG